MGHAAPSATSEARQVRHGLAKPLRLSGGTFSSLRFRLLALVVLAIVPALILILYFAWDGRQDAKAQAQTDALTLTQLNVVQQQQVIEGSRQLMASLALLSGGADLSQLEPVSCQAAFANILTDLNFYANFGIATADGNVVCTAIGDPNATHSIAERASARSALASEEFGVGQYVADPISGRQVLDMTYPIKAADGTVSGLLFLDLDLGWLNTVGEGVDLPNGATFTILDRENTIIARYPDTGDFVGQRFPNDDLVAKIVGSPEGVFETKGADGVKRLFGFTQITTPTETGLSAVVGIPTSTAYASVNTDLARNLAALMIVAVLVMAAAWFGGDFLVLRQTRRLLVATNHLSNGDLTTRSGFTAKSGEIGMLGQAFDEMAGNLEQRDAEQRRAEADLRRLNESLEERIAERTAQVELRSEELRLSNSELEDFTYVVSHDLKEPLRGIEAFSTFLEEDYGDRLDAEGRRYVTVVRESAVRMKQLIENLLELSRVGRQTISPELVSAGKIVKDAVSDLAYAIEVRNVDLQLPTEYPRIHCDPVRIGEVFKNLISNAIKFNKQDRPVVALTWEREGNEYKFSIKDNGIGLDPAYHDKVFVIFQRLERREDYPGSGAGLTICKKIVETHGGRIGVTSTPGEGSTFWFTLPAEEERRKSESNGGVKA